MMRILLLIILGLAGYVLFFTPLGDALMKRFGYEATQLALVIDGPKPGPNSSVPGEFSIPASPDLQAIKWFPERGIVFLDGISAPAAKFVLQDGTKLTPQQWAEASNDIKRQMLFTWHHFPQGLRVKRYTPRE